MAAFLLALCAASARADVAIVAAPPRQRLSIGVGLVQPASKVDFRSVSGGGEAANGDLGSRIGVEYLYFLTPRLGAGLGVDYIDRSATRSESLFPAAAASVSGESWLMLGILRYSFREAGSVRPFVLVGAGGARNTTTIDVRPGNWADTNTHETRRLIDDTVWTPAASARVGVDLELDSFQPGIVTLDVGWIGLASARYGATARGTAQGVSGVSGPLNLISFTARYGWKF